MLRIVVLQKNETEIFFYKFLLEQQEEEVDFILSTSVKELCSEESNFFSFIGKIDMLILSYELPASDQIIDQHISKNIKVPLLVTFPDKECEERFKIKYKYNALISHYNSGNDPDEFLEEYKKLMKFHSRMANQTNEYTAISVDYLLDLQHTSVDLYIKLSDQKYVKIIRRMQDYSRDDIAKYADKDVNHFYVKKRDLKAFSVDIGSRLRKKYLKELEEGNNSAVSIKCHEFVYDVVHNIGLDQSVMGMVNLALTTTLQSVFKTPLKDYILEVLQGKSYVSEHSLLVSYIACTACRHTEWYNNENIMRLTVASFFHDIKCLDDSVALIKGLNDPRMDELSRPYKKNVTKHALEASKIVNEIKGIPMGVDKIVANHHEKYDGSGFPRGIDYKSFDPITAIFCLSHEVTDMIYESGLYRDNVIEILREMKLCYTKSFFPKVVDGLIKSFGLNEVVMRSYDNAG